MAANELTPEEKIAAKKAEDRARMAKWRKDHPEENKARQKKWSDANRAAKKEFSLKWRAENAEHLREYYRGRKPQMAANARRYEANQANRMTILIRGARVRAKQIGVECDGLKTMKGTLPAACACCGFPLDYSRKNRERSPSLDRHDSTKGYVTENVRVICYRCNRLKSDATIEEVRAILAYMLL